MLQTSEKPEVDPEELADDAALPADEVRHRLYHIASDARLISVVAHAINADEGAGGVDHTDPNTCYAIQRAADRIEERLLALAGGPSFDQFGKAVKS